MMPCLSKACSTPGAETPLRPCASHRHLRLGMATLPACRCCHGGAACKSKEWAIIIYMVVPALNLMPDRLYSNAMAFCADF